jgi:hypothetical protein
MTKAVRLASLSRETDPRSRATRSNGRWLRPRCRWTRRRQCCATAIPGCGGCSVRHCRRPRSCPTGGTPRFDSSTRCGRPVASLRRYGQHPPGRRSGSSTSPSSRIRPEKCNFDRDAVRYLAVIAWLSWPITAENGCSEDLPRSHRWIPFARFAGSCFCGKPAWADGSEQ